MNILLARRYCLGTAPCPFSITQSKYHLSVDNFTHLWALARGIPKLIIINLFSSIPLIIVLQSCLVQVVCFPLLSFPVIFRSTQTHLPRRRHLCSYRFYIKPMLFAFLFYLSETIYPSLSESASILHTDHSHRVVHL